MVSRGYGRAAHRTGRTARTREYPPWPHRVCTDGTRCGARDASPGHAHHRAGAVTATTLSPIRPCRPHLASGFFLRAQDREHGRSARPTALIQVIVPPSPSAVASRRLSRGAGRLVARHSTTPTSARAIFTTARTATSSGLPGRGRRRKGSRTRQTAFRTAIWSVTSRRPRLSHARRAGGVGPCPALARPAGSEGTGAVGRQPSAHGGQDGDGQSRLRPAGGRADLRGQAGPHAGDRATNAAAGFAGPRAVQAGAGALR